jgi:hypothetical protein
MKQYKKYLIRSADLFDIHNFPAVADEVRGINEKINSYSPSLKAEILIPFLKNHSLEEDWISANPAISKFITSGAPFTSAIEALFDSCIDNPIFREGFEKYLVEEFVTFRATEIAE